MIVQVVQGRISDAAALRASLDRWARQVAAGAPGWLGTTAGVTDDGRSIALNCFASPAAARLNSDRPEQRRWWAETSALLGEPVVVRDCGEATTQLAGWSDDVGFVQVTQGRFTDVDRTVQVLEEVAPWEAEVRPDVIGGLLALHGDGGFTEAVYFTSERAAREGDRRPPPADPAAELDTLVADVTYFDLRHPWLYSPA